MEKISGKKEREIVKRIQSYIAEGTSHCDPKHARMEENNLYANTEQWSKGDILRQTLKDRPAIPWNSIFKIVQAIANREIVERFVPKVFGRSDADAGIADILDEACKWQREISMSEHVESSAVRSTVIGGYGWMHKYWDPSKLNGDGQIVDEDVPIWEMLWPQRARRTNLDDRRWHVRGKWITYDEARARWGDETPKLRKMFKKLDDRMKLGGPDKNQFPDTTTELGKGPASSPFGWGSIQNNGWVNTADEEVFVVEAEWIEPEVTYKAAIPARFVEWEDFYLSQGSLQLTEATEEAEAEILDWATYQNMTLEEQQDILSNILLDTVEETFDTRAELNEFSDRYEMAVGQEFEDYSKVIKETVRYALVLNDSVLDYGIREWGFSYFCITGFPVEARDGMDFIGAVDIAKGPQDYKNALISNMMAMYMSSPKAPILVEKSAVPNIDEFTNKLASPSAVVPVPDGFLQSGKFQILPAPSFPQMISPLLDLASRGVEEAFGFSSIDLGTQSDLRRVSGTVVQASKAANNVIIALIFDSIRFFRKKYGICNVRLIAKQYSPQEIIRIVGEEKVPDLQTIDITRWGDVLRYDIHIDESPSSPSELMELSDFLTRTGTLDNWLNRKEISFEDALRLLPQIPESDKRAMVEGKSEREKSAQQIQQLTNQLTLMQGIVDQAAAMPEMQPIIQEAITKHQLAEAQQPQS